MSDPDFRKYHGRFHKPVDDDITRDMYLCDSYYPAKKDTSLVDSTAIADSIAAEKAGHPMNALEKMVIGNSVNIEPTSPQRQEGEKEQKKNADRPHEEVIRFDDL